MNYLIENPCNEDWSRMSPSRRGRFCKTCNTHVHDLTLSSYESALEVIIGDDVCVRIYQDQQKEFQERAILIKGAYLFQKIRAMAATFFTLLALEVFMLQRSFAQSTPDTLRIPEQVDSADRTHYNRTAYNCISGKIVIKETGTSRKGMHVQLYDAERNFIGETFSTEDGSFLLVIPDTANADGIFYVKVEKEKIKNRRYITHFRMAIKKIRPDQRKDIIIEIDRDRRIRSWPFQQRVVITGRFI